IADGADELGTQPDGILGDLRALGEGSLFGDERLKSLVNCRHGGLVESGPDVAGPDEPAFFVNAEYEGAEVVALAFGVAAENALGRGDGLDLDPAIAAAGFVAAVGALGDDAFEALFARGFEQRLAFVESLGNADQRTRFDDGFEQLAALGERNAAKVVAV